MKPRSRRQNSAAPVLLANQERLSRILLGLALLSGVAFMAPVLRAGPLALDEHGTYWLAGPSNPSTMWHRSLHYENIPPLAPAVQRLFLAVFGESELVFRLPGILCYLGAIVAAWYLGRDLADSGPESPVGEGPAIGGLTALLLAWRPFVVGEVRVARVYGFSLLLATLAFWAAVRWLREPESRRWAALWTVCAVGMLWTHYLNGLVVILQFLVLLQLTFCDRVATKLFFFSCCVVAIGGYPLLPAVLRMAEDGQYFNFQNDLPFWYDISHVWWFGLPGGWLAARLVDRFWRRRGGQDSPSTILAGGRLPLHLLIWGVLPVLLVPVVCTGSLTSLANPRYRIGFAAPGACVIAWLVVRNVRWVPALLGVAVTLGLTAGLADVPPWKLKRLGSRQAREWRHAARLIEEKGNEDEPLFVQSGLGEGFLIPRFFEDPLFHDFTACRLGRFYLKRPHRRLALPFLWGSDSEMPDYFRRQVEACRETTSRSLWLVCATDTDLNRLSMEGMQRIIRRAGGQELERHRFNTLLMVRYSLAPMEDGE